MPVITIDGANIHYLREGSGPAIILLHSLGGGGAMWRSTIDALKDRFTVIAPDARGHGQSEAKGDIAVERFAQDARAIADHLKLDAFGVVGLSMGGQAAMHVAARDARTRWLVAADTSVGGRPGAAERVTATRERIAAIGPKAFAAEYAASRLQPGHASPAASEFEAMVVHTLPDIYVRQFESIQNQDMRPVLPVIKVPTLVMVGRNDGSTPPAAAQVICDGIAGAKLTVIEDANHLSNIDQPDAFNAALKAFATAQT